MIRAVLTTGLSASALPSWSSAGASLFLSESPPCSHRHGDDWGDGDDDDEESDNYDDGDEKPELPEWWVHHLLVEVGQVEPGDHHADDDHYDDDDDDDGKRHEESTSMWVWYEDEDV